MIWYSVYYITHGTQQTRLVSSKTTHLLHLQSIHFVNSIDSQFNDASIWSLPLLPLRWCTLVLHFTSHIFLLLTVLLVFSCHLSPLTSYKSCTITLFSVPAHSVQLLQVFQTLFLTHSVHLVHSTLSGHTSNHTFTKQLLTPPNGILQHLWLCD